MAAWLAPALKAVMPHLGTIVSAVAPAFTRNREAVANQMQLLQEQIAELQAAASQNAAHIKELAMQVQSTVSVLERAATVAEARLQRALWFSVIAVVLAAVGVILGVFLVVTR